MQHRGRKWGKKTGGSGEKKTWWELSKWHTLHCEIVSSLFSRLCKQETSECPFTCLSPSLPKIPLTHAIFYVSSNPILVQVTNVSCLNRQNNSLTGIPMSPDRQNFYPHHLCPDITPVNNLCYLCHTFANAMKVINEFGFKIGKLSWIFQGSPQLSQE